MLRITTIQSNIIWEDKAANIKEYELILKRGLTTDVIIFPEMFTTGFTMNTSLAETMSGETVSWMIKKSKEKDCAIIGSLIIEEDGNHYNRLLCVQGDCIDYYDKKHLFSFAGEDKHYTPGDGKTIVNIKGWKILLQICYDLRFPVFSRNQNNYDAIIYVANWPKKRSIAWNALLQARAIENQAYVIGVNRIGIDGNNHEYSGESYIVSPIGSMLYRICNAGNVNTLTLDSEYLKEVRQEFPFLQDADDFRLI